MTQQQEAMVKDVPGWAYHKVGRLAQEAGSVGEAFARYIAAHEQPPVDPLRAAVVAACTKQFAEGGDVVEYLIDELRNRIPNIDSLAAAGEGE